MIAKWEKELFRNPNDRFLSGWALAQMDKTIQKSIEVADENLMAEIVRLSKHITDMSTFTKNAEFFTNPPHFQNHSDSK